MRLLGLTRADLWRPDRGAALVGIAANLVKVYFR